MVSRIARGTEFVSNGIALPTIPLTVPNTAIIQEHEDIFTEPYWCVIDSIVYSIGINTTTHPYQILVKSDVGGSPMHEFSRLLFFAPQVAGYEGERFQIFRLDPWLVIKPGDSYNVYVWATLNGLGNQLLLVSFMGAFISKDEHARLVNLESNVSKSIEVLFV